MFLNNVYNITAQQNISQGLLLIFIFSSIFFWLVFTILHRKNWQCPAHNAQRYCQFIIQILFSYIRLEEKSSQQSHSITNRSK